MEETERPAERLGVDVYMENLKNGRKTKKQILEEQERAKRRNAPKHVVAGAEFLDSIPHAPWPSRSMLKVYFSFVFSVCQCRTVSSILPLNLKAMHGGVCFQRSEVFLLTVLIAEAHCAWHS